MAPGRQRELRAEVLEGTHDWQKFYNQYAIGISGLVPNVKGHEPDVNHCWRFVRRDETQLQSYLIEP